MSNKVRYEEGEETINYGGSGFYTREIDDREEIIRQGKIRKIHDPNYIISREEQISITYFKSLNEAKNRQAVITKAAKAVKVFFCYFFSYS